MAPRHVCMTLSEAIVIDHIWLKKIRRPNAPTVSDGGTPRPEGREMDGSDFYRFTVAAGQPLGQYRIFDSLDNSVSHLFITSYMH